MRNSQFTYDSTTLVDVLGLERASEYLRLAETTHHYATILRVYGLLLIVISCGLLALILSAFIGTETTARFEFLQLDRVRAVFFSSIPFTILGIYVLYKAHRIRKAARDQIQTFESAIERAEREYG